jgi:hypothetical protein
MISVKEQTPYKTVLSTAANMETPMDCAERNRLWAEFKARLAELNEKVDRISGLDMGAVFNEAVMAAKQASHDCDRSQLLWEEHMREHRCDVHGRVVNEKPNSQRAVAGPQALKRRRA